MAGFCRSKYWVFPEYHTSADDLDVISPEGFQGSFDVMMETVGILEHNVVYRTTTPCEPQLGKRGLYPTVSQKGMYDSVAAMMDLLAYANGERDLITISEEIGVPARELIPIARKLEEAKLIERMYAQ